jgi:hypothetical protein
METPEENRAFITFPALTVDAGAYAGMLKHNRSSRSAVAVVNQFRTN